MFFFSHKNFSRIAGGGKRGSAEKSGRKVGGGKGGGSGRKVGEERGGGIGGGRRGEKSQRKIIDKTSRKEILSKC